MNSHFASLVIGLGAQAASALEGNVPGEVAGADPKEIARSLIDTLGMIEEKTRGNLSDEEHQLLSGILTDLRIRFVQGTPK